MRASMPPDSGARKLSHWASTSSRLAVCRHQEVNWVHCVGASIETPCAHARTAGDGLRRALKASYSTIGLISISQERQRRNFFLSPRQLFAVSDRQCYDAPVRFPLRTIHGAWTG